MESNFSNWKIIADTLQDGLMVIDQNGEILDVNQAAEKLTGYTAQELIGKSCRILNCTGCDIIGKGEGKKWCKLFSSTKTINKSCQITDKNRRIVQVLKSASVLRDRKGTIIGAVETLTDMSEIERQHLEIMSLRKTYVPEKGFHGILGKSLIMQQLFELISNVSLSNAPVMIHGQSGTGKEMVARAIHDSSPRRKNPFIKVNCAALNENLLESELFGHIKGAFTGADQTRIGRFEAAQNGTIFLDEVGDIPLPIQVKLLRVLEEKEIERVGDHRPIPVDVRIVTATNRNLDRLIEEKRFRKDFFFRINVFPLCCPPLQERLEDVPLIVQQFISNNNTIYNDKKILGVTAAAMEKMLKFPWTGNIRELRNAIDYAFVLCPSGKIDVKHLPPKIIKKSEGAPPTNLPETRVNSNREELLNILRKVKGNQSEAARMLGVSRVTIWKRIKKYKIDMKLELQ